jgi:hypothetical protein
MQLTGTHPGRIHRTMITNPSDHLPASSGRVGTWPAIISIRPALPSSHTYIWLISFFVPCAMWSRAYKHVTCASCVSIWPVTLIFLPSSPHRISCFTCHIQFILRYPTRHIFSPSHVRARAGKFPRPRGENLYGKHVRLHYQQLELHT